MKRILITIPFLFFLLLFNGCTVSSRLVKEDLSVYDYSLSSSGSIDEFKTNKIGIKKIDIPQNRLAGRIDCRLSAMQLQQTLIQSLQFYKLFAPSNDAKYLLKVSVLNIDQPGAGFDMKVKATFHWSLFNTQTNENIYSRDITTQHITKMAESFNGYKRLCIATREAIKKNIGQFLTDLSNSENAPSENIIY